MDKKYLDHLLHEYLDGELSPAEKVSFEEALETDAALAERLHALAKVRTLLAEMPREQMAGDISSEILKAVADGHKPYDPPASSPAIPEGTITPDPGAERAALQKMLQNPRRFSLEWVALVVVCVCLLVALGVVCQVYFPYQGMISTHLDTGSSPEKMSEKTPEKPESAVRDELGEPDESGEPGAEDESDKLVMRGMLSEKGKQMLSEEALPASGEAVADGIRMMAGQEEAVRTDYDGAYDVVNNIRSDAPQLLDDFENEEGGEAWDAVPAAVDSSVERAPDPRRHLSRARYPAVYDVSPKQENPAAMPATPAAIPAETEAKETVEKTVEKTAFGGKEMHPARLHAPAVAPFMATPPASAAPVMQPDMMPSYEQADTKVGRSENGSLGLEQPHDSLSLEGGFIHAPGAFAAKRESISTGADGTDTSMADTNMAGETMDLSSAAVRRGTAKSVLERQEASPAVPEEEPAPALENAVPAFAPQLSQRVTVEVQPAAGVSLDALQAEITSQLQSQVVRVRDLREILKTWQSAGKIQDYRVADIVPADSAVQAKAAMAATRVFEEEVAEEVDAAVMMDTDVPEESD